MAKKQKIVLIHRSFGEVVIKSSFLTASSGSQFFTVLCPDGTIRNLLAEKSYWVSDAVEVAKQFKAFSAVALAAEAEKRKAERKKDRDSAAAKNIPHDKKMAMERLDEDEIKEVEINYGRDDDQRTDELEYTAASDF